MSGRIGLVEAVELLSSAGLRMEIRPGKAAATGPVLVVLGFPIERRLNRRADGTYSARKVLGLCSIAEQAR